MTSTSAGAPPRARRPRHGGDRLHREGNQLDVVAQQRGIEVLGENGPLAGVGVFRGNRLGEIGPVGEDLGDVGATPRFGKRIDLGAGPVQCAEQLPDLDEPELPQSLATPCPGPPQPRALLIGEVAVGLVHDPTGFALKQRDALGHPGDRRNHLHRTGSGAYYRDLLAGQIHRLPPGGVQLRPGELVESRPGGVVRDVEHAHRADDRPKGVRLAVCGPQQVATLFVVPDDLVDRGAETGSAASTRTRRRHPRDSAAIRPGGHGCGSSRAAGTNTSTAPSARPLRRPDRCCRARCLRGRGTSRRR